MLQVSAIFQVIVSVSLLALILMHSGRDAGIGGMGFTPASQGGTHIVERNLTRLTVVVATSSPQQRRALPAFGLGLHCSSPRWWRNW